MSRNHFVILIVLSAIGYIWLTRPEPSTHVSSRKAPSKSIQAGSAQSVEEPTEVMEPAAPEGEESPPNDVDVEDVSKPRRTVLRYKIQDGLMIVQGDVMAGAPSHPGVPPAGMVEMPRLKLWPGGMIPYHIQPNVPNPERILQAIAMFEGTAVRFTPYNGEPDAIVFEVGEKNCLSYVGRMGGNQPVFLSARCSPEDIAHELLHVLGFVHEQNRADRDSFINVLYENIEDDEKANFEKLPQEYMKLSGLAEFDYQSLMIYPVWMFAKNGQSTMEPKARDRLIQPGARLSAGDVERINRAYGGAHIPL